VLWLGLYDTDIGLGLILGIALVPLSTILYRQFFVQVPETILDSARVDGGNHFHLLGAIVLPMAKVPMVTVSILSFAIGWNAFLRAVVLTSGDMRSRPMSITIQNLHFFAEQYNKFNEMLAGAIIMAAVPMAMYFFGQRYITQGLRSMGSGEK
jgi:ABC-type glycerol-3-phosphate transport system permease component